MKLRQIPPGPLAGLCYASALYLLGVPVKTWHQSGYSEPDLSISTRRSRGQTPLPGSVPPPSLPSSIKPHSVVVVFTDCAECSLDSPSVLKGLKGKRPLVLVQAGHEESTPPGMIQAPERLLDDWHVTFAPRVYTLDRSRRVHMVQTRRRTGKEFRDYVQSLL